MCSLRTNLTDIAKTAFHVHIVGRHGQTQWQGKYSRATHGFTDGFGIHANFSALFRSLEDAENGLSDGFRILLNVLAEDLQHLDDRVAALDQRITESVNQDPVAGRLMTLRGVGPLNSRGNQYDAYTQREQAWQQHITDWQASGFARVALVSGSSKSHGLAVLLSGGVSITGLQASNIEVYCYPVTVGLSHYLQVR